MTQEKQRVKRIYARMTPSEYLELQEQADAAALTISEFVRRRLFGRRIISKVELRVLSELRKLGGLLKHIHNETGGVYSEDTRDAIQALTAYARNLERAAGDDCKNPVETPR